MSIKYPSIVLTSQQNNDTTDNLRPYNVILIHNEIKDNKKRKSPFIQKDYSGYFSLRTTKELLLSYVSCSSRKLLYLSIIETHQ